MKKLLSIICLALVLTFAFAGCKSADATPAETTTVNAERVKISTGVTKGGIYKNKSLGLKIYCPVEYNSQTAGDLVITPETIDSLPNYDYFIIDTEKESKVAQSVSVTIENEADSKLRIPEKTNPEYTIGGRKYKSFEEKSKNKKVTTTYFFTKGDEKIVIIEFDRFTYDEAVKFIDEYFKTL